MDASEFWGVRGVCTAAGHCGFLSFREDIHGCLEKLAYELVSFLVTSFQSQGS